MSEKSLDEIMSGRGEAVSGAEPTAPTHDAPTTEPTGSASRDDKGRFAAKPETTDPQAAAPAATPDQPAQQTRQVPVQALDAERGKRKETEERYERELKELREQVTRLSQVQQPAKPVEPPAPPPTLWDAPDEFIASQLSPVQQQMADMREFVSENLAVQAHGAEKVEAAKRAIEQAAQTPDGQQVIQRLMQSRHPFDDLVKWHTSQSFINEIGHDPDAYKQRIIQEYLAQNPQAQQPQPTTPAPAPVLPTSFAGSPTSGPRGGPEYSGPRALSDIMKR